MLPESTLGRNNGLSAGDELTFEVQNPLHRSEHSFNEDDDDIFNANNGSVSSESLKPSDGPADAQPTYSDVLSSDALYGNFGTTTEYVNPLRRGLGGEKEIRAAGDDIIPDKIPIMHTPMRSRESFGNASAGTASVGSSSPPTSPYEHPGTRFRKSIQARSRASTKGPRGKRRSHERAKREVDQPPLVVD